MALTKQKIACSMFMMITVTCCFAVKCWTLVGPFLVIIESGAVHISKAKMWHFTRQLPAVIEIQHVLHVVGYLSDLGFCGGGWCVFREC